MEKQNIVYIKLIDLYKYFKKIPDKFRTPQNFIIYLNKKYGVKLSSNRNKIRIYLDIDKKKIIPYTFRYNNYSNRINYEIIYNYNTPGGKIYNISGVSSIDKQNFEPESNKGELWIGTFGTKLKSTKKILKNSGITKQDFDTEIKSKIGENGMNYIGRITLFLNGCVGTQIVKFEDSSAGECITDPDFSNITFEFIELLPLRLMIDKESIYSNLIPGKLLKQNEAMYKNAKKVIKKIGEYSYSKIKVKRFNDSNINIYDDILIKELVSKYLLSANEQYKTHNICGVIYNIQKYIIQELSIINLANFKKFYFVLDNDNIESLYKLIIG